MSEFKNKSITSKGVELLSKALAGEQLTFTKIEMGSGLCEGDTGEATALVQLQQTLPITKISRKGGQVTLSAALKIEDITNSFEWTEIGVYAKGNDGVEVIYMYGYTQNSSFISKDSLNEKLINITAMVSNATNITATIDNSLVYLTAEALSDHEKDISTHQDIRDEVTALGEQLGQLDISWESIEGKPSEFPSSPHNHTIENVSGLQSELDKKAPTHSHPYASSTHAHTKADIGLSNVPNYSATSSVSDSSNSKFATAGAVKQAYDKAVDANNKLPIRLVPSSNWKASHTFDVSPVQSASNVYLYVGSYFEMYDFTRIRISWDSFKIRVKSLGTSTYSYIIRLYLSEEFSQLNPFPAAGAVSSSANNYSIIDIDLCNIMVLEDIRLTGEHSGTDVTVNAGSRDVYIPKSVGNGQTIGSSKYRVIISMQQTYAFFKSNPTFRVGYDVQ